MRQLIIDGRVIHDGSDCFVIAEIGHNHQGRLDKAREMFAQAKQCGVNAVKLQKRDNRTLYTRAMYYKPYDHEQSFGATYGAHREALEFGRREFEDLKAYAKELGLVFFATAFDIRSADFLAELDMPAYKIASGDLNNISLLRHVARIGRPILLSTGGGTPQDVQRAYEVIMPINPQLCILQCTAAYPADFAELNLRVIATYRDLYPEVVVGYSGHDNGIAMAVLAYALGARVIEKHFTLNRAMKGTDHAFSLEPVGMRKLVRDLRRAAAALGDGVKRQYESEIAPLTKMGKKIVAARDLPAGHRLSRDDLALKSPGDGLAPYHLDELVGKILREPLMADDAIVFEILDEAPAQMVLEDRSS